MVDFTVVGGQIFFFYSDLDLNFAKPKIVYNKSKNIIQAY